MARNFPFTCVDCGTEGTRDYRSTSLRCDDCRVLRQNRLQAERMAARRANDPAFLEADRARVRTHMRALRAGALIRKRPAKRTRQLAPRTSPARKQTEETTHHG